MSKAQLEADLKAGKIISADDEEWLDRLRLLQCPMTANILARSWCGAKPPKIIVTQTGIADTVKAGVVDG